MFEELQANHSGTTVELDPTVRNHKGENFFPVVGSNCRKDVSEVQGTTDRMGVWVK